ncbi:MAG: peptide ABC transporter substrate-binding protein [Deltaproteobacteria bacterium]|nr:peptide ABC transporter substrate-binding protein [Deltaproteobacteria bacterium]
MAKKRSKKGFIFLGIFVVVFIFAVFLALQKNSSLNSKDQIVVGFAQEPDSLHPLFQQMAVSTEMYALLFEDLVEYDNNWKLYPRLAESIPSLEKGGVEKLSGNRMRTTWKLKEGLKWSDGWPLTAHDFVFAHEVIMDNRVPVVSRDRDERIQKIEAKDDRTFVVTWKQPYAYYYLGHSFLPKHVLEKDFKEAPDKMDQSEYNRKPLGNGAYVLNEWKPGSYLSFSSNPNYFGEKPSINHVIYNVVTGGNTLESELVSGKIKAISTVGLNLPQALGFEERKRNDFNFYYIDGMVWEHVDVNLDDPILKERGVRQALLYGMNRVGMVEKLFSGKQAVSHSWLPPKHYGYNPNVKKYPYDPLKAEQILEDLGWKMGSSGVREKDGKKLEFTIMTTADNKARSDVQQLIQADWRKIGVKLEIKNQPAKVFFGETVHERKFQHFAMYAWVNSPQSDGESLWTIKNIPSKENNWQGQNNPGWRNEEANKIDIQVPVTLEESKRKELLSKEQEIWVEDLPALPLFWRVDISVTDKELENWKPTGTDTPVTWNAESWKYKML